jgi:recA bacterial DNA recombination protein
VGAITELVAPPFISAGQKSIQAQLLARATQEQLCALVDATDSFHPKSAQAIGVNLRQLLWVRCSGRGMKALEQAFQCADLLLQGSSGFGAIIVDLASLPPCFVRKVPLTTWFRFRAVVEKQETALVFSTPHAVTSTCSELVLAVSTQGVQWSQATELGPTHARVFAGFDFQAEIARKRFFKKPVQPASHPFRCYPRLA